MTMEGMMKGETMGTGIKWRNRETSQLNKWGH